MPEPIIAASFTALLEGLRTCFTAPSFAIFRHLMSGWVLSVGGHAVTRLIVAADVIEARHHSTFQRFFRSGRWRPDDVSLVLLRLIVSKLVPPFAPILRARTRITLPFGPQRWVRFGRLRIVETGGVLTYIEDFGDSRAAEDGPTMRGQTAKLFWCEPLWR